MEMRIAVRLVMAPDFSEGVRAVIVDKDNHPRWTPSSLPTTEDGAIDAIFAPLPPTEEWSPL
jgi:enoyl-CoA hydratase